MRLKGSYTVEASLLMCIIIPLLAGIIYLGFYMHNNAMMQNAAYELVVLGVLQTGDVSSAEERMQAIEEKAFIGLKNIESELNVDEDEISARLHGTFRVPGLVMRFFCGIQMEMEADAKLTATDPGKTIIRIHLLEKIVEEAMDGSDISP